MKIYADHAATTKLDKDALKAMIPFLTEEYANASQTYLFADSAKNALETARHTIAECINAEPEEIYFTSSGTESDNWAVKSTAFSGKSNGAIVTTQIEHKAVLLSCKSVERLGCPVIYLPVDRSGVVHPEYIEKYAFGRLKLLSVMYANNEIGSIQPIKQLCEKAHEQGAVFHTDAVQALGHIPVDVKALGVDMLSGSAHKFNGPKGIGFLYIKRGTEISPYIDGGGQEHGMRSGTENIASIVGMAAALKKNCSRMNDSNIHLNNLENLLISELKQSKTDFILNGSENRIPSNMSLSFKGADGEALMNILDFKGICVSAGSACNSRNTEISHVLEAIGVPEEYAAGTIRISLGYENTVEDVHTIAKEIIKILNYNFG